MSVSVGATDDEVMVEEMLELKLDDVVVIELELESSSEELVLDERVDERPRVELV